MPAFDRVLIDPPADALAPALTEAMQTANKRCRVGTLKADDATFRTLAGKYSQKPQGSAEWVAGAPSPADLAPDQRATLVGAAWWTDALGHKHLRVVGRRLEPGNCQRTNRFGPLAGGWPPLGRVYPDRVVVRTRPGQSQREVLAVCECGAIGAPEALAWMGERCGPCHDRHQEVQSSPTLPGLKDSGTLWTGRDLGGVAYSAKGALVWADTGGTISCGGKTDQMYVGTVIDSLAFACNGKVAGLAGYVGHTLWDADTGRKLSKSEELLSAVRLALAISPDGKRVADTGLEGSALWSVEAQRWERLEDYDRSPGYALAFSPDGKDLVEGKANGQLAVFGSDRPIPVHKSRRLTALAFSPDGRMLAVGTGSDAWHELGEAPGEIHLLEWGTQKRPEPRQADATHAAPVCALAFSCDGRALASGGADRAVRLWDVAAGRLLVTLEWHLGPVRGVAFSPDGERLASASADGAVRLWDWRRFLD